MKKLFRISIFILLFLLTGCFNTNELKEEETTPVVGNNDKKLVVDNIKEDIDEIEVDIKEKKLIDDSYNYIDRDLETIRLEKECSEIDIEMNKIFGNTKTIIGYECILYPELKNTIYNGERTAVIKIYDRNVDNVNKILLNENIPTKILLDYGQYYHSSGKLEEEIRNLSNLYETEYLWGLDLGLHYLNKGSITRIFSNASFVNLKFLDLSYGSFSKLDFITISNRKDFIGLETLNLSNTFMIGDGLKILSESNNLINLKNLDLGVSNIGDQGVEYLSNSEYINKLETLDLGNNKLTDKSFESISNSKNFKNLKYLDLRYNDFTDNLFNPLLESKPFTKIISLDLSHSKIGDNTLKIISENDMFSDLEYLNLSFTNVSDEGIKYLSNSTKLKKIRYLSLGYTNITNEGIDIMNKSDNFDYLEEFYILTEGITNIHLFNFIKDKELKKITTKTFNDKTYVYTQKSYLTKSIKYYIEKENKLLINDFGVAISPNLRVNKNGDISCSIGQGEIYLSLNCVGTDMPTIEDINLIKQHIIRLSDTELINYGTNLKLDYGYGMFKGDNNLYKIDNEGKKDIVNLGDINICKEIRTLFGEVLNRCVELSFDSVNNSIKIYLDNKVLIYSLDNSTFTYEEYNDNVIIDADNNELVKANEEEIVKGLFFKGDDYVYFMNGNEKKLIKGADVNSFVSFGDSSFSKDKNNIFYRERMIKGVDKDTFRYLSFNYGIDENNVYIQGAEGVSILEVEDINSFKVINKYYSKDNKKIYIYGKEIVGVDLDNFEIVKDNLERFSGIFSKDLENVYRGGQIIEGAKPENFNVLGNGYSIDGINVFFQLKLVEGADVETFRIVEGFTLAKDKDNEYYFGKIKE